MSGKRKVVAIIQARMESTRLPGKVLRNVNGIPLLEIVIDRIKVSKNLDVICVAVPNTRANDQLVGYCESMNVSVFRGSEKNVLSRFYYAATKYDADIIVRLTSDDPLKDSEIIDNFVDELIAHGVDYVSNTLEPTYPEGLDTEVFTYDALKKAFREARLASEKEHVTPYIWKNPSLFNLKNVRYFKDYSHLRWTIDKSEDVDFFDALFSESRFDIKTVSYIQVLKFLDSHPELSMINADAIRNEGYLKSLAEEQ